MNTILQEGMPRWDSDLHPKNAQASTPLAIIHVWRAEGWDRYSYERGPKFSDLARLQWNGPSRDCFGLFTNDNPGRNYFSLCRSIGELR